MVKEFLELIKLLFPSVLDGLWFFILGLILFLIYKAQPFKVYEHFSTKRGKDYLLAKDLLAMEKLSKDTQLLLIEYLERHAFNKYYGIDREKIEREILIKFHKNHEKELTWKEIKKAISYLKIKDNKITVKFNKIDTFFYYLLFAGSVLMFLFSFVIIYILGSYIIDGSKNYLKLIELFIGSIVMFLFCIFLAKSSLRDEAAIKIKKILLNVK